MLFVTLMVTSLKEGKIKLASEAISCKRYGLVEFSSSTKLSTARKQAAVQLTTIK